MNKTIERKEYLDFLRFIAITAVLFMHVAAENWHSADVSSFNWAVFNFYDACARYAVPLFVMITGTLFGNPDKQIDIKRLYKKNISRIIIAFAFWSVWYTVDAVTRSTKVWTFRMILKEFIKGPYHFWYMYMIVGIYILVPILRKITEDPKIMKYFLGVAFVFTFLFPSLLDLDVFSGVVSIYNKINWHFTLGHVTYFVLGYYLSSTELTKNTKRIIYLLGVIGFVSTVVISYIGAIKVGKPWGYYDSFNINVLFESVFIYVAGRDFFEKFVRGRKFVTPINVIAKYSFGIYLVHVFFIRIFMRVGFDTTLFNPILSVPVKAVAVCTVSLLVVFVISKIPVLKKYII